MKATIIALIIALGLIGFVVWGKSSSGSSAQQAANQNNVTMESGTQIITINARGGYAPQVSVAKAGIPTVLRMQTQNTFDCSSAVAIPALNYRANLPQTGTTDIPVSAELANGTLSGMCSMGMYRFEVQFQ